MTQHRSTAPSRRVLSGCATGLLMATSLGLASTAVNATPAPVTLAAIPISRAATSRVINNVLRLRVTTTKTQVQVAYWVGGIRRTTVLKAVKGVAVVDLPASSTRVFVRIPPQGKLAATAWVQVKVAAKTPPPPPKPKVVTITINTCEQLDAAAVREVPGSKDNIHPMDSFSSLQDIIDSGRNNLDAPTNYVMNLPSINVCRRVTTPAPGLTTPAPFSLGSPSVSKCSVVPADGTGGWTADQLKKATGYDYKGFFVTVAYPVTGRQRYLDVDQYDVQFIGNASRFNPPGEGKWYDPNYGKLITKGSWKWLNGQETVPATTGDTLSFPTQDGFSATEPNAGALYVSDKKKLYWSFMALAQYPTTTKTVSSDATTGWSSTVRTTKFIPATGNSGDGVARMGYDTKITRTPGATRWHKANYFDSDVKKAATVSYSYAMYGTFDMSRWNDRSYWISLTTATNDVEGLSASETWSMDKLRSACDTANANTK